MLVNGMNPEQRADLDKHLVAPEWDLVEPDVPNPLAVVVVPAEDPEWRPAWWVDDPVEANRNHHRELAKMQGGN
jgi:hypothetical protein